MGFQLTRTYGSALVGYYVLFLTCALIVQIIDKDPHNSLSAVDKAIHKWFGDSPECADNH